ncbi:MAG TPA: transglutaminase-like domain-containing protein, partial [Pseudonocardiaceae bacterium]|nr:transglutaminase-like domain-containing protein [Pseudonocardiaceae bacterium]
SDALVDFLFNGKTGYCEQYSSTMAVMLRAIGIPVRVDIGFTDGYVSGNHRVITAQDAHAWDEVFFPDYGWITFDPTPLSDGRSETPAYLNNNSSGPDTNPGNDKPARQNPANQAKPTNPQANQPTIRVGDPASAQATSNFPIWQLSLLGALVILAALGTVLARRSRGTGPPRRHQLLFAGAALAWVLAALVAAAFVSWWLVVLVIVLGAAAGPAVIREFRRRQRLHTIARLGANAAGAAWSELLAESWDRGTAVPGSETVRVAATRLAKAHDLDHEGKENLTTLVGAVERSFYGANGADSHDPTIVTAFDGVRRSLHRNAPLALGARLLPRSVLKPRKR